MREFIGGSLIYLTGNTFVLDGEGTILKFFYVGEDRQLIMLGGVYPESVPGSIVMITRTDRSVSDFSISGNVGYDPFSTIIEPHQDLAGLGYRH